MKITDSSVWTKEELVKIINHFLSLDNTLLQENYLIDFRYKKQTKLLDEVEKLIQEMKGLEMLQEIKKNIEIENKINKINKIYKIVHLLEKSLVVNEECE